MQFRRYIDIVKAVPPVAKEYIMRDSIILRDVSTQVVKGNVNLHWWRRPYGKINVGDYLSCVIVEWMKKECGITSDSSYNGKTHHLYALGSIIDSGFQDATVWGSGCLQDHMFWWRKNRKLDICSVRGPLTREVLQKNGYNCPEIYGDPAILMPMIYKPKDIKKNKNYVVISHHSIQSEKGTLSPVTTDYISFINKILEAELVISSSLHGIILAEAYGVPAVMLGNSQLDRFKYYDWYYSTERYDFPVAQSVEEALHMKPVCLPNLSTLTKQVVEAFPEKLWHKQNT